MTVYSCSVWTYLNKTVETCCLSLDKEIKFYFYHSVVISPLKRGAGLSTQAGTRDLRVGRVGTISLWHAPDVISRVRYTKGLAGSPQVQFFEVCSVNPSRIGAIRTAIMVSEYWGERPWPSRLWDLWICSLCVTLIMAGGWMDVGAYPRVNNWTKLNKNRINNHYIYMPQRYISIPVFWERKIR